MAMMDNSRIREYGSLQVTYQCKTTERRNLSYPILVQPNATEDSLNSSNVTNTVYSR